MKKILILMMCVLAVSGMSGCGKKEKTETVAPTPTPQIVQNNEISTVVEEDVVKLMLPVSIFGEAAEEKVNTVKENNGFSEAVISDSIVVFTMTQEQFGNWKMTQAQNTQNAAKTIISDERFLGMTDVVFNESYTEASIVTQKNTYKSSRDAVAAEGVAQAALIYQKMTGVNEADAVCTVNFMDGATGEVLESIAFPKA